MRTTVICIQAKRKRKLDCDKVCNSENIDPNNNENVSLQNKKIKSVSTNVSPILKYNNHEAKPLKITHDFIRSICDTIKKSAKRIFQYNLFDNSDLQHKDQVLENKENELSNVQPVSKTTDCDKIRRPNFSLLNFLPLNENLCLQDAKFVESVSTKMSFVDLAEYLDEKKHMLRRSKTTILPSHVICSSADIQKFVWLIEEDPMISLFLKRDICRRYADKYLLAMVLIYFARAHFTSRDFSRENFFAALYLAHDMEEDHEEIKYEIFPYCLGTRWRKTYPYLLSIRDDLFWSLDCRAVVSYKCCEQVMSLIPNHWIWDRERPPYHAVVNRLDTVKNDFGQPRGPFKSPLWCRACLERECMDSENSYIVYTSCSDASTVESPDLDKSRIQNKDSGFESFLQPNDAKDDDDADDNDDDDFDTSLESDEVLSLSPEGVGNFEVKSRSCVFKRWKVTRKTSELGYLEAEDFIIEIITC